ncbi:HAMP domain-containing histidine kinase [Candidatus Microgenomates bacterium]|nr:HAMP domain-containing histidine kinase [Candidatus Microgenomates bacterium]
MKFRGVLKTLWSYLILPKSANKDKSRREFILNILLLGSIILAGVAFFINLIDPILYPGSSTSENPLITGTILTFLCLLLLMSRFRKSNISAILFIALLYLVGVYVNYRFGPDLSQGLLLFALLIVMAGILISTKSALIITVLSGLSILLFSYLQINNLYQPNNDWKIKPVLITDAIVYVITLGVIAIVSYLSNREIEKALKRAWRSEAALRRQRDQLEIMVEKRTHELRQTQVEKISQLYRFAEFGRSASGLFHDLVNPLTLISLNLNKLTRQTRQTKQPKLVDAQLALERAIIGTKRLESFIQGAKKQIQDQVISQKFSLKEEIVQAIQMLGSRARANHVRIVFQPEGDIETFANPLKFNQLITNLVSNAIDAYDGIRKKQRVVEIRLSQVNGMAKLEIQDWGSGIDKKILSKIFDPLFTTKGLDKGTGIGLSICKDIIEKDFQGKYSVDTKVGQGTTFTVEFPLSKSAKA